MEVYLTCVRSRGPVVPWSCFIVRIARHGALKIMLRLNADYLNGSLPNMLPGPVVT